MSHRIYKAAIMIIGSEILSGKIQDKNVQFLATELNNLGIRVYEIRMVLDIESDIISTIKDLSSKYDYVFTTGGIGPTHDDITMEAIAKSFGKGVALDQRAYDCLLKHYKTPDQINEARIKMAYLPEGSDLIDNPISHAPGAKIENVYIMAGVPRIVQAMFNSIKDKLEGGVPMKSVTVATFLTEGIIATKLTQIQANYPDVEIGSYPFVCDKRQGTRLVSSGYELSRIEAANNDLCEMIKSFDGQFIDLTEVDANSLN